MIARFKALILIINSQRLIKDYNLIRMTLMNEVFSSNFVLAQSWPGIVSREFSVLKIYKDDSTRTTQREVIFLPVIR